MPFSFSEAVVALSLVALGHALPTTTTPLTYSQSKRSFDCSNPVQGLNQADCNYMSSIGIHSQGINSHSNNGNIWVGSDGPNTFSFKANAGVDITLIFWANPTGDYQSSFMNVRQPQVSYSIANGQQVTISMENNLSGGWAGLYDGKTTLSSFGQIFNTWGEITTGPYGTVDVSREVNMGGNGMSIKVASGCVSDMDKCSFHCNSGTSCGESGTYSLMNCAAGSQSGASYGVYSGNPSGGCQGFANGGHMDISFTN